jgi:hypothetical protein
VENRENRDLLARVILAMIVTFEAVVGGRKQLQTAPPPMPGEGCHLLDRCLGDRRDIHSEPFDVRHRSFPVVKQGGA